MASSSGGPDVKDSVFCINCRQQIQLRLHVKCCECPAMICAECFSYGCEAGQHLRGHNYEICDPLGGRTFDVKGSWGAIEERKLLAAAYRFKLGNWGEVTRLMETNRPISQVQEYYDRFFIRGPVGQFALKLLSWEESKRIMLADGSLVYNCETDRIIYLLMAMDAYKDSKEKLDPCDEDLASKVDAIMQSYTFHLNHNDETHQCSEQAELPAIIDLALSDDSCDPSDYDMEKKAPDDAYSTGLEPENDSEEDEVNNHSVPHSKPTKVDSRSLRSSLRTSVAFMRPRKKKTSVRKSAVEKNERTRRYRRVQPDSSSSDDDSGNEDEVEPMETDRTSIDDAHDSMHGLEKEDSTDDCSGSDSEEPKQEAAKQSATSLNSSVRKKRRARFVSKKARRLKEFQKRMARMTKVAERRLHELSELCPLETIRELRNSKPDLALYTNDYVGRPKVRQSDMDMLAYNAARGDFEWEWFNDAEQLISRLMIQESSDRVEDLENDIKFARIEKYYRTLKTRKAYRRAIVEHDKISEFFRFMMNMTMEKRKASQIFAQRPPLEKLLIRAQQCLTKRETEDLRSHVERADELMGRIAKLQELQRNGVTTLKEAVFLVVVLCWMRFLMDSLPTLIFLSTLVELYQVKVLSWTHLLNKVLRCFGGRKTHSRQPFLSCSLEFKTEEVTFVEEILVENLDGQLHLLSFPPKFHSPSAVSGNLLRRFRQRGRVTAHYNGETTEEAQHASSVDLPLASQSSGSYPVNVDAVLGANTVEDIADTHPDFARLLLDCYSAGCDLEEYKREFQRLKNLRIKRQGGVNQTLSFSLFPSVPSDLPGHLFVRLLKFHSLYEGACRKYLTDVVNKRVEASPGFPYDLSTVGLQDLVQGGSSTEYYRVENEAQSASGSYVATDAHFVDPSGVAQGMSSAVAYSPAVNSLYSQRFSQHGVHLNADRNVAMTGPTESTTCMQRSTINQMQERTSQSRVASIYVDRRMTATPLPSWSQQSNTVSEVRSRMATPLPPLEIKQCPVLQAGLSTPVLRTENRPAQTSIAHHRHMATPIPGMEGVQSYSGMCGSHGQHYQQMPSSSEIHGNLTDNRGMMASTPMIGSVESSSQASPFATPTKKPRARRKPVVTSQAQIQGQQAITLHSRQMNATPIPGWQEHHAKSNLGVQGQPHHIQHRNLMSASVTPLQRQLRTPMPDHREMMNATPLPGWAPNHVGNSSNQVERSPLVSSLPPLSQFTPMQQSETRQLKTPYPSMQNRQLVTPVPHTQQRAMSTQPYEQSSHVYTRSRELMTPAPFAQTESVSVPYVQSQNIGANIGSATGEMYPQQSIQYQWSEGSSMDLYSQQRQFVQHSSYGQQSQFNQEANSGSQPQSSFVANQTVQYLTPTAHSQYPQASVEVQKGSAFSQPYHYVQQTYTVPSDFQQQSSYSQDSNFGQSSYPQRSPFTHQQRQQTEQSQQQQQNQPLNPSLRQHLSQPLQQQQQQPILRQVYENSAQFVQQYNHLVPNYSTQPGCGMQSRQLTTASMQVHQMPRSCDVTDGSLSQQNSDIAHQDQQSATTFAAGLLEMNVSSGAGVIVDLLRNDDPVTSGVTLDAIQSDYTGMVSTTIADAPIIDSILDGQLRTFGITQCPPPPRNDSEATVPARASPSSCSPGLIVGEDESNSLIPSFFYPKDFVQNDLNDLRIEDSPIEKTLNCQHFRFDIILAMKHHRIGKEDYERTLRELDEMEKEKCVGPLGDLLMKRLGLKRQSQYTRDGKFSVEELVAAFAANAKIQESSAKMPERRMSSELFSELLEDITPVQSNTPAHQFNSKSCLDSYSTSSVVPNCMSKLDVLQSGEAMNDLGYLLSDDVIAEFDSMSGSKPLSAGVTLPYTRADQLSTGSPSSFVRKEALPVAVPVNREVPFDKSKGSNDSTTFLTSGFNGDKTCNEIHTRNGKSIAMFSSSPIPSLSTGEPATSSHGSVLSSSLLVQGRTAKELRPKTQIKSKFSSHPDDQDTPSIKVKSAFGSSVAVPRKLLSESDPVLSKTAEIGAPAQSARLSDVFPNESYGSLSPFVISPEPLSDEDDWWRKDDETPPMLGGTPLKIRGVTKDLKLPVKSSENPKPYDYREKETTFAPNVETPPKAAVPMTKRSPKRIEEGNRRLVDRYLHSPSPSHKMHLKSFGEYGNDQSYSKTKLAEQLKRPSRKVNKTLFISDSSSDDSVKEDTLLPPSTSRVHQSTSLPSLPCVSRKKSYSPRDHHSPRSGKKKNRKSSLPSKPSKESKELPQKSGMSKVELSREVLAKQIADIIEDERSKLPPEEARLHRRPLSPASLDVVIQDLMQHHISEDASPNRELFASKLLGTDIFSKLFFRAGKCVFRHYEELDDFRSKEKGRGRRKGAATRKRDTELLRGIRKSREIQKYKDALRAAKEPSEAEKKAAAERAKLEAMPWLARSTFKPDVQQGTSSRFVIPKKSSGNRSGGEGSMCRVTREYQQCETTDETEMKSSHHKMEGGSNEQFRSWLTSEKVSPSRRSRSPPTHPQGGKVDMRMSNEERLTSDVPPTEGKVVEVSANFSFCWMPKSSTYKARAKHTWPLKRWRSAFTILEAIEVHRNSSAPEEHSASDSVFESVMEDVDIATNSFTETRFQKAPIVKDSSSATQSTSFVSARESELAALALQEEMSRNEQDSPDVHYDALRYLAAMSESEFSAHSDSHGPSTSTPVVNKGSKTHDAGAALEVLPESFTSDQLRGDPTLSEHSSWTKMDTTEQPFYGTGFDNEPWSFSLSNTHSQTSVRPTENTQSSNSAHGENSLYSSLQEELDTIVRDTLGDTLYNPAPISNAPLTTIAPSLEKFEWPKADVPVRSYALDIVLPPLLCDKSKIAILDMCRCQRCTTRCEYFCDHEEWKYLYDYATSRPKKQQKSELCCRTPSDQICVNNLSISKKPEERCVKSISKVFQYTSDRDQLSIAGVSSNLCSFIKSPAVKSVKGHWWIYQRAFASRKFNNVCAHLKQWEICRPPCLEEAIVVLEESQYYRGCDHFPSFASPISLVVRCENETKSSAVTAVPINQVTCQSTAMSIFATPVAAHFQKGGSSAEYEFSISIPRNEVSISEITDLSLSYAQENDAWAAIATINVPRKTSTVLNIVMLNVSYNTPQWITETSVCSSEITFTQPRLDATNSYILLTNVVRKRVDSIHTTSTIQPIPRLTTLSFACIRSDRNFLISGPAQEARTSLPLPVADFTFYRTSQLRVRRRRLDESACADIVLSIPRLGNSILSVFELIAEENRADIQGVTEYSIALSREEKTVLNITEINVHRYQLGFIESWIGIVPIPRVDCTATEIQKLNVKRKRTGVTASSDAVITIPRVESTAFSVTEAKLVQVRGDSRETFEVVSSVPREETATFKSFTLKVKRINRTVVGSVSYSHPTALEEKRSLAIYSTIVRHRRVSGVEELCYSHPTTNITETACSITDRSFDMINREIFIFGSNRVVGIPAEDGTPTHIFDASVRRSSNDQLSLVQSGTKCFDSNRYSLAMHSREDVFENELSFDQISKSNSAVVPIPCGDVGVLCLPSVEMSRKRKHKEESTLFMKRIKIEDQAGPFITDESFFNDANRVTEVVHVKDPRLPLQCSNTFMEVSMKWRCFAHQHMPHMVFSSYLVTQFATLLQRVFDEGVVRYTITMKELSRLIANKDGRYDLSVFTSPNKVMARSSDPSGPIWGRLVKLRMQRNSTELLNRQALAPLYIFLGLTSFPRLGKPWRRWLKPVDVTTESRIGCQLALCMRIPDLVGVDDMDSKLQAIKMWWTFMMIRGTLSWYIYPCFSRRQLFLLVRLLEALQDVEHPPFCLYPPKVFFKAVKKVLRHPRLDLIPKDVYHPDITTMATLLKMKRSRVFHVDRSLPELLSHWMDDMNKIDAYLAADVKVNIMSPSSFLTQSEWVWKNFGRGCVPDSMKYDRSIGVEEIMKKLADCVADVNLTIDHRKRISALRTAIGAWSNYESGPSVEQIPVDIINPFALSASFIALLPMPDGFVDECFTFLEKVSKKSTQPRQNPTKRSTKSSLSWKWKPSERLVSAGKPINVGIKANGKTTINTLFEEFWKTPKDFSTISVFNKEESMTSQSPSNESSKESLDQPVDGLIRKPYTTSSKQSILTEFVDNYDSVSGIRSSTVLKKSKQASDSFSVDEEKNIKPCKRWRKRKDSVVDEVRPATEVMRPFKKLKIEMRKRRRAKTSEDEGGPTIAKQRMTKISEYRSLKLRHTLARRGIETERMLHETVLRAVALMAVQGPNTPVTYRKSAKRQARDYSSSNSSDVQPSKPSSVKKSRPARIFDVANFEWVLEMSLRRPRAFVGLYKTMKCQYRVLEKRRWVEKNRRFYDRAQFEKSMGGVKLFCKSSGHEVPVLVPRLQVHHLTRCVIALQLA
nr:C. briggsae CBR-ADA-2 protein [Haemonchus contortus]